MIATWEEINSRYDAIKDHKPRAAKKLKELGEILASAYKLDPQRADEMWQYVIDLNIKDDIAFSKFYIAQVFNKITDNLPSKEAGDFVSMRPERVRLMLMYGYDGDRLYHVTYTVIVSHLLSGRIHEAAETVSILYDKLAAKEQSSIYSFCWHLNNLCVYLERLQGYSGSTHKAAIPKASILVFYEECREEFGDAHIQAMLSARICVLSKEPISDLDSVRRILSEEVTFYDSQLFVNFLYLERDVIGDEAENIVYGYCTTEEHAPLPDHPGSKDNEFSNAYKWYQEIITHSERILLALFDKEPCWGFIKAIIHGYIYESDWKSVIRFLVLGLNQENENYAVTYLDFIKKEIQDYRSLKGKEVEFENGQWWLVEKNHAKPDPIISEPMVLESLYGTITITSAISVPPLKRGIARPSVTEDNVADFICALARICILTSGSAVNGQLIDEVSSFINKETGSMDALTEMGIDIEADKRSEIEKFCDYAEKESVQRLPYDNSYYHQIERKFISNIQEETETYGVETGKLLAKQPQIVSFLFLHDAHSSSTKADIILGALLDGDFHSALKCVDYMIETAVYPNFSDCNSWSEEMKNTVCSMLRIVYRENASEYGKSYPESVTSAVIQIAERCLPYLGGDDADEVKKSIINLKPAEYVNDGFIRHIMQDVDDYTAKKKPKGFSKRINNVISDIKWGIEVLSRISRMDVVAQILRKISEGKKYITGSNYESWMPTSLRITERQYLELYSLIPDVFADFIEHSEPKMALDLLRIFGRLGNLSVYEAIRSKILQIHGYIEGMRSCFRYSEETADQILLCKNRLFEASFLYWNANDSYNRSEFDSAEVVIRVRNRSKAWIDLLASAISVNGIQLSELKRQDWEHTDGRKIIGYYSSDCKEHTEHLSLSWDEGLKEVAEIAFTIIAQCEGKDISLEGPFAICRDPITDTFKLKE